MPFDKVGEKIRGRLERKHAGDKGPGLDKFRPLQRFYRILITWRTFTDEQPTSCGWMWPALKNTTGMETTLAPATAPPSGFTPSENTRTQWTGGRVAWVQRSTAATSGSVSTFTLLRSSMISCYRDQWEGSRPQRYFTDNMRITSTNHKFNFPKWKTAFH